jgi:hypothetical protein
VRDLPHEPVNSREAVCLPVHELLPSRSRAGGAPCRSALRGSAGAPREERVPAGGRLELDGLSPLAVDRDEPLVADAELWSDLRGPNSESHKRNDPHRLPVRRHRRAGDPKIALPRLNRRALRVVRAPHQAPLEHELRVRGAQLRRELPAARVPRKPTGARGIRDNGDARHPRRERVDVRLDQADLRPSDPGAPSRKSLPQPAARESRPSPATAPPPSEQGARSPAADSR